MCIEESEDNTITEEEEQLECAWCGDDLDATEDGVFEASGLWFCGDECHQNYLDD